MSRVESHWGYCPFLEEERCIYVTYSEVRTIGRKTPGYKRIRFTCDYSDECKLDRDCPVYQDAPAGID